MTVAHEGFGGRRSLDGGRRGRRVALIKPFLSHDWCAIAEVVHELASGIYIRLSR